MDTEISPLLKSSVHHPSNSLVVPDLVKVEIDDDLTTYTTTSTSVVMSRVVTVIILVFAAITCTAGFSEIKRGSIPLHLRFTAFVGDSTTAAAKPCDIEDSGVSYCPGKLPGNIENVHLQPGCIMMSVNDLTTLPENPDYDDSDILTICASMGSGVVMVDYEKLKKYNMIGDDKSYISSILFSDDSQMKLFSGKNFDGAVMGSNGTPYTDPYTKVLGLSKVKYSSEPYELVNDNVYSFLFATSAVEGTSCLEAMKFDE